MFNFINNIVERRFLSGALVGSLMLLGVSMLSGCGDKSDGDLINSPQGGTGKSGAPFFNFKGKIL